ncbi:MAG: 2-C-methyl-D-erythritol 2,4-cyclodiphosphate synthase [Gammaproteobacteria bacterium]|nr:MAG: 2-C-methyl-D-erythritol 2,4-cyclodiphosphate synthase [Gammaproteobacteria bacterium]RLA13072.1 MAG: 2-C-methyl-D-erythritol 2,4-cyclodiphosphate synthase [Gammaproteobacteria bacterium]
MRVGQGYDLHRLAPGETLVLGGVELESTLGTVAHSDGDVLLHALCDALLGAAALGDIGRHFPDSDPAYRGISSRELLCRVVERVRARGFNISNIDATIVAEAPKLAPHVDNMCKKIASACGLEINAVNVKATTQEKVGPEGREEAISAQVIVLLESQE